VISGDGHGANTRPEAPKFRALQVAAGPQGVGPADEKTPVEDQLKTDPGPFEKAQNGVTPSPRHRHPHQAHSPPQIGPGMPQP